jgi:hypothetical protein
MRKLRAILASILMFAALTVTASTVSPAQSMADGGDLPPLCVPGTPNCP